MNKNQLDEMMALEGELEKMSSSVFIGYQTKFWKILKEGTQIGYRNQKEEEFKNENIFQMKQTRVEEGSQLGVFQLLTQKRKFVLKAKDDQTKKKWMRAITQLRKNIFKKVKIPKKPEPTVDTVQTQKEQKKSKSISKLKVPQKIKERRKSIELEEIKKQVGEKKNIVSLLLEYMPEFAIKYNTLLIQLKIKEKGFITDDYIEDTFLLVSPKSLYPDVKMNNRNIMNKDLPPWAEVNHFYKVLTLDEKPTLKSVFNVNKINDFKHGGSGCSARIDTGEIIYEFFCQTVEQRQRFIKCLETAKINAHEVLVNGKVSKINYDALINSHETKSQDFYKTTQKMLEQYLPNATTHKYQPQILVNFLKQIVQFLNEFISILEQKKLNKNHVILDVLQVFHEEAKIQIKLTWDSSYQNIKGVDILHILECLSLYYQTIKEFITSIEFVEGMKELSKIYVRTAWKNFQSIIINIVDQEKQLNILADEDNEFVETNGVIDLFKFIYDVYELAAPHWRNKIHLHNVHKLMLKTLTVFIDEIRAMIDEEVIPNKQMAGLANNYFRFSDLVNDFYKDKFLTLHEKSKDSFDACIKNYREIAMIVLDKFCTMAILQLKIYINGKKLVFSQIKLQQLFELIVDKTSDIEGYLHIAFKKKIYEKIAHEMKMILLEMLAKQQQSSKKNLKFLRKKFEEFTEEMIEGFRSLNKSHYKLEKELKEVINILSTKNLSEIQTTLLTSSQKVKELYCRLLNLRDDYGKKSPIYKFVTELNNPQEADTNKRKSKIRKVSADYRDTSLSKKYFMEEIEKQKTNSEKSFKAPKNEAKLITEGYMMKGKNNKKVEEQAYFRIRNGYLYIFPHETSERCNNAIDLKNCNEIMVKQEKPSFVIKYMKLSKLKEIKMKCEDMDTRDKWVMSIESERKRIINEEKVKRKKVVIKENGRKKKQLIIDHWEVEKGRDYFSYNA